MLILIKNIKQIVGIDHTNRLRLQGKEMAELSKTLDGEDGQTPINLE